MPSRISKRGFKRTHVKRRVSRVKRTFARRLGPSTDGTGRMSLPRAIGAVKNQEMRGIVALYNVVAAPYSTCRISRPDDDYSATLLTCRVGLNSTRNVEWWFGVPHFVANSPFYLAMAKTYGQIRMNSITLSYVPMNLYGTGSVPSLTEADSFPGTVTFAPDTPEYYPTEATDKSCSRNFASSSATIVNYAHPWTVTIPLKYKPALFGSSGDGGGTITNTASGWVDIDLMTQQWKYLSGLIVFSADRVFQINLGAVANATYNFGHLAYSVNCSFRGKPDVKNMAEPTNAQVPGIVEGS